MTFTRGKVAKEKEVLKKSREKSRGRKKKKEERKFWMELGALKCYKISSRHLNDKYIYCYHYLKVKHTNYNL